jgi:ribosomal protein S18 acetylase RimI-like enzyme
MSRSASIVIRPATTNDAGEILACLVAAFEPYREHYTRNAYLDTVLAEDTLQQRLLAMKVLVAVVGDSIAGTIACARVNAIEGHLRGMAVIPQWQGQGIAEKLLTAAEQELAQQCCSRITLDTTAPLQRAMRFYEKHGYHRSGRITDFFGMALYEYVKELRQS